VKDEWEQHLRELREEVKLAEEKEKEAKQASKLCRKQEKEFFNIWVSIYQIGVNSIIIQNVG